MRNWLSVFGIGLFAATLAGGPSQLHARQVRVDRARGHSIVLVTIDTLRADHLGAYGYFRDTSPNLDAFAKESILFESAITPMATTLPAHLSILTSTNPRLHGVMNNDMVFEESGDLLTFATMLGRLGWETAGFVSAAPLRPETGVGAGFETFEAPVRQRRGDITVDHAIAWLRSRKDDSRSFFLWVHLFDPHRPYSPPKDYRIFEDDTRLEKHLESIGASTSKPAMRTNDAYDGEIRFADAQVAKLLAELKARGLYEDAAVVVTADHGEGLYQHHWKGHGRIYNEQLFVPLMLKPPRAARLAPRRIDRVVSTIDIVPTLTRLLAIPLPAAEKRQFEGVDLLSGRRKWVFSERVHRKRNWEPGLKLALTGSDWKYFALTEAEDQLFDLKRDPHELHDVLEEHLDVAKRMRGELRATLEHYRGVSKTRKRIEDKSLLQELRALGYID